MQCGQHWKWAVHHEGGPKAEPKGVPVSSASTGFFSSGSRNSSVHSVPCPRAHLVHVLLSQLFRVCPSAQRRSEKIKTGSFGNRMFGASCGNQKANCRRLACLQSDGCAMHVSWASCDPCIVHACVCCLHPGFDTAACQGSSRSLSLAT